MDAARLRQRSASHSSLRSQYRYQTRMINYTNPRPPAQRHPLRSVNENVALLRSPDPLESMLKTTTETGDIGIFSIGPHSSSASFARPKRSRSHPRETILPLPARLSAYDEGYYCHPDGHKRLRSYRDTTSEIISLYGSESQKTLVSSVSPTSIDDDPRSYSMTTTTSSKRIPSQKSTGTLQSQSSGSGFQRPRSPFPYPTRLKRPGVRPASPALRENGDIDYSRMVELDRFSQRTIHGSYKPTYAHGPRRPLPMAFRPDVNRSTSSLPSRTAPSPYLYAPVPCQVRGPNSSLPWGMSRQPNRHHRGSTDQSTRSASLTSIVEMYDRPMTSNSNCAPPLQSPGSFYYDYSEQFEDQSPWDMDMDIPLHPIPQRVENIRRSLLLMDNIQGSFEADGNYPDSIKSHAKEDGKASIEPSQLSDAVNGNSEDTESKQSTSDDEDGAMERQSTAEPGPKETPLITISDEEQDPPPTLSNRVSPDIEADAIDMLSMTSGSTSLGPNSPLETPSKILETNFHVASECRSRRSSQVSLSKLRYSLDPALSEFASVLSSFDRLVRIPATKDCEVQSISGGCHDTYAYQQEDVHPVNLKCLNRRPSPPSSDPVGEEDGEYLKCHRRNVAAMRISITGIVPDEVLNHTPERHNNISILSPEPISPVRELRVKESIPQLMKALPPLPREAEKLSGYGTAGIPTINVYQGYGPLISGKDCPSGMRRPLEPKQTSSSPAISRHSQDFQPKFKLRARAPSSPGKSGDVACKVATYRPTYNSVYDYEYIPTVRPKLKLKLPRNQVRPGQTGLSPYNNRLKQCNSLAELTPRLQNDTADEHIGIDMGGKKQVSSFDSLNGNTAAIEENSIRFEPSPQPSDQFNIPYPSSPPKVEVQLSPTAVSIKGEELIEIRSSCVDNNPNRPRGLRGKLSVLRLRFTSPQRYTSTSKETLAVPCTDEKALCVPITAANKDTDDSRGVGVSSTNQSSPVEAEKVGWRVKRWARDAKKAVRLYVKRTLERSPKVNVSA